MATHSKILAKTLACYIKSEDLNLCSSWEGPGSHQPYNNYWWDENDGQLGTVASITAVPSAFPCTCSPAGCNGVLRWSKHKKGDFVSQRVGKATDGTRVVQCSDTQQLSQGGKVQRRAASAIRNMFWAWGLEELKIGTCGPNYRTKEKKARKRNNLGKLGTVDQPEYCKQHEILLLLSLQKRSESCNRWPTLCMGIKCMGA